jgi:putative ABC transport system substrate-binding protein
LRDLGYVDGQTISIEWRFTTDSTDAQLSALAEDLAAQHVDMIVALATPASIAARQATTSIPILALDVGDPVQSGLVKSMAQPGGNVTAISNSVLGVRAKLVEFLRLVVPGLARVAVLVDPTNPANVAAVDSFRAAAESTGVNAEAVQIYSEDELPAAFETDAMTHAQAVYVQANPINASKQLADLLIKHRIPSVGSDAQTGVLISYSPDNLQLVRQGATYVDRILKGANPADMPVQQPTAYVLSINIKTAEALGITIPPDVANQVTNWIQ